MLLIRPSHPPVIRLKLKTRLRMQQKIRPPNRMKQFQPVATRLVEAINLSKTKHKQQQMRQVQQTRLSSLLVDRMRLPSQLLITHLVPELRNKDSLLRLKEITVAIRVQVVLRHQDQLEGRHQETKPRQAVQILPSQLLQVTRLRMPQLARLDRPKTSLNTFSQQGRMLSFEVT